MQNGLDIELDSCIVIHIERAQALREAKETKQMETQYITPAETAKLIRAELKATFTGVKFSVRKEHFAIWITIPATASVTVADVETITNNYAGSKFDSQTDMYLSETHIVDGLKVRYLADHVFVQKDQVA